MTPLSALVLNYPLYRQRPTPPTMQTLTSRRLVTTCFGASRALANRIKAPAYPHLPVLSRHSQRQTRSRIDPLKYHCYYHRRSCLSQHDVVSTRGLCPHLRCRSVRSRGGRLQGGRFRGDGRCRVGDDGVPPSPSGQREASGADPYGAGGAT